MLQKIREHAQGWIAWIIILLVCSTFALFGVHNYVGGSKKENTLAKVNGIVINDKEVRQVYEQLKQSQLQTLGQRYDTVQFETRLKQQALQELINYQVLVQGALTEGYRVTPQQINVLVYTLPLFQVNNQFSPTKFQEFLRSNDSNSQAFLEEMNAKLLIDQVRMVYLASSFALPSEIKDAIQLLEQKRTIRYLIIPTHSFLDKVALTQADLQTYYEQHKNAFISPEQVKVDYIALSLTDLLKHFTYTSQQLQDYYTANQSTFRIPGSWHIAVIVIKIPTGATQTQLNQAKQQVEMLEKQLKEGKDFAALAKQYSQDLLSKSQGGDIGWIKENDLGKEFYAALSQLKKKGEVSAPVLTQYGYNLIKLLDSKPAQVKPFLEVKDQIKQMLVEQQAQKRFAEQSERLSDLTYSNADTLAPAAKELALPIMTSDFFSQRGGNDPITKNPKIVEAAFSEDVLHQNYNSSPIQVGDETMVVLRINKHLPATIKPFAEVRAQIQALLAQDKAIKMAEEAGQTLLKQIETTTGQGDNNAKWVEAHDLSRDNKKIDPAILSHAFAMYSNDKNTFPTEGFTLNNGDYALLTLQKVIDGNPAAVDATKLAQYKIDVERRYGWMDYQLYLEGLRKQTSIEILSPHS